MRLTRLAVALFALPWLVLPSLVLAQQRSPAVTKALDYLKANHERHLALQVSLAEVAAPTFHEGVRATRMAEEFRRVGLKDVAIDPQGNVLGWRPGASPDALVVAAHLDISFDTGVDTHVRKDGARWFGPGLSDDSRGLAAILAVAEALNDGAITTRRTLLFVANTGEEGLGDLNGVKYLFQKSPFRDRLKAFISVDGDAIETLVTGGTGVKRYKISVHGPGGHSYGDFGRPNAIHALGRIANTLAGLDVPKTPKTTYNIGRIGGGTVVNAIAEDAWMEVDLRSESPESLARIERALLDAVPAGITAENAMRAASKTEVIAKVELIGNRPAGQTSATDPLVQAAQAAVRSLGKVPSSEFASTDANLAMSLGLPAITVGGGGRSGNAHSLGEWFEPAEAWLGPQSLLLTIVNYDAAR